MPRHSRPTRSKTSILDLAKEVSGRRIELGRKWKQVTQAQLAGHAGIGVRWLREIESGNPKSRIDDHFVCAHQLGISSWQIVFPMLILEHDMNYPRQLLHGDMTELERRCIGTIVAYNLEAIAPHLDLGRRQAAPGNG